MEDFDFLYNDVEETRTRYVCFIGKTNRFDLAITTTDRFYGKKLVFNIQTGRAQIIGTDDLDEPGYIAYALGISEEEEEELKQFLYTVI
ncbi:MAG: DUF3055 domain-containing protein [Bacillaceae bacterium]|nr:DUF3055 domain-containing protein [Bacillaceae bacterium]